MDIKAKVVNFQNKLANKKSFLSWCVGCFLLLGITGFFTYKNIGIYKILEERPVSLVAVDLTATSVDLYWKSDDKILQTIEYKDTSSTGIYKKINSDNTLYLDNNTGKYVYHASIDNLDIDTTYNIRISSSNNTWGTYSFSTKKESETVTLPNVIKGESDKDRLLLAQTGEQNYILNTGTHGTYAFDGLESNYNIAEYADYTDNSLLSLNDNGEYVEEEVYAQVLGVSDTVGEIVDEDMTLEFRIIFLTEKLKYYWYSWINSNDYIFNLISTLSSLLPSPYNLVCQIYETIYSDEGKTIALNTASDIIDGTTLAYYIYNYEKNKLENGTASKDSTELYKNILTDLKDNSEDEAVRILADTALSDESTFGYNNYKDIYTYIDQTKTSLKNIEKNIGDMKESYLDSKTTFSLDNITYQIGTLSKTINDTNGYRVTSLSDEIKNEINDKINDSNIENLVATNCSDTTCNTLIDTSTGETINYPSTIDIKNASNLEEVVLSKTDNSYSITYSAEIESLYNKQFEKTDDGTENLYDLANRGDIDLTDYTTVKSYIGKIANLAEKCTSSSCTGAEKDSLQTNLLAALDLLSQMKANSGKELLTNIKNALIDVGNGVEGTSTAFDKKLDEYSGNSSNDSVTEKLADIYDKNFKTNDSIIGKIAYSNTLISNSKISLKQYIDKLIIHVNDCIDGDGCTDAVKSSAKDYLQLANNELITMGSIVNEDAKEAVEELQLELYSTAAELYYARSCTTDNNNIFELEEGVQLFYGNFLNGNFEITDYEETGIDTINKTFLMNNVKYKLWEYCITENRCEKGVTNELFEQAIEFASENASNAVNEILSNTVYLGSKFPVTNGTTETAMSGTQKCCCNEYKCVADSDQCLFESDESGENICKSCKSGNYENDLLNTYNNLNKNGYTDTAVTERRIFIGDPACNAKYFVIPRNKAFSICDTQACVEGYARNMLENQGIFEGDIDWEKFNSYIDYEDTTNDESGGGQGGADICSYDGTQTEIVMETSNVECTNGSGCICYYTNKYLCAEEGQTCRADGKITTTQDKVKAELTASTTTKKVLCQDPDGCTCTYTEGDTKDILPSQYCMYPDTTKTELTVTEETPSLDCVDPDGCTCKYTDGTSLTATDGQSCTLNQKTETINNVCCYYNSELSYLNQSYCSSQTNSSVIEEAGYTNCNLYGVQITFSKGSNFFEAFDIVDQEEVPIKTAKELIKFSGNTLMSVGSFADGTWSKIVYYDKTACASASDNICGDDFDLQDGEVYYVLSTGAYTLTAYTYASAGVNVDLNNMTGWNLVPSGLFIYNANYTQDLINNPEYDVTQLAVWDEATSQFIYTVVDLYNNLYGDGEIDITKQTAVFIKVSKI